MLLDRSHSPQNLGNSKNAHGSYVNEDDFMNKNLEQLYSSNIIPNAEINIETDMGCEEWCVTEGLTGLKSTIFEKNIQPDMSVNMAKHS